MPFTALCTFSSHGNTHVCALGGVLITRVWQERLRTQDSPEQSALGNRKESWLILLFTGATMQEQPRGLSQRLLEGKYQAYFSLPFLLRSIQVLSLNSGSPQHKMGMLGRPLFFVLGWRNVREEKFQPCVDMSDELANWHALASSPGP